MKFRSYYLCFLLVVLSVNFSVPNDVIASAKSSVNVKAKDVDFSPPLAQIIKDVAKRLRELVKKNIENGHARNSFNDSIDTFERTSTVLGKHDVALRLFYRDFNIPKVKAEFGDEILEVLQIMKDAAKVHRVSL